LNAHNRTTTMVQVDRSDQLLTQPAGAPTPRPVAHDSAWDVSLESAITQLPAGVALVRATDGSILSANRWLETMLRYQPGELVGEGVELITALGEAVPEHAAMKGVPFAGHVRALRRDGTTMWCHAAISSVPDRTHGEVLVSIRCDIDEGKQAQEQLGRMAADLADAGKRQERLNDELSRSNADLTEFASVAAHDLKSPLQTIAGYAQLLRRHPPVLADEESAEFVEAIARSAHRLQAMIDGLLTYARVGTSGRRRRRVDWSQLIADVEGSLATQLAETAAELTWSDLPPIQGDALELCQLFRNVIDNAIKYRRPDEPPRVTVTAQPTGGDMWRFEVRDNGIGIEPAFRTRVFRVFQRTGAGVESTGIGLPICRRIVEGHGGRMWVEENGGGGTLVCFTLPTPPVCWNPF
jgi:PAS domain S-box-containing protein